MLSLEAVSNTYAAASVIVEALGRDSWEDAFTKLSEFTGSELQEVADKAIALGADPGTVQALVEAQQPSETVFVTGTAPVAKAQIPWFWIMLAALAIGGAFYFYRKRR